MNAPWPNAKTHRLFQVPERGCSQGQQRGIHPAHTPPHTPRAGQPTQAAMQVIGGELRLTVSLLMVELRVVAAATGGTFVCETWLDDTAGVCRWRGRRASVKPPCQVRRETSSQAHAHESAGAPAPTAAAQEHAARITEADTRTGMFEGVM